MTPCRQVRTENFDSGFDSGFDALRRRRFPDPAANANGLAHKPGSGLYRALAPISDIYFLQTESGRVPLPAVLSASR